MQFLWCRKFAEQILCVYLKSRFGCRESYFWSLTLFSRVSQFRVSCEMAKVRWKCKKYVKKFLAWRWILKVPRLRFMSALSSRSTKEHYWKQLKCQFAQNILKDHKVETHGQTHFEHNVTERLSRKVRGILCPCACQKICKNFSHQVMHTQNVDLSLSSASFDSKSFGKLEIYRQISQIFVPLSGFWMYFWALLMMESIYLPFVVTNTV